MMLQEHQPLRHIEVRLCWVRGSIDSWIYTSSDTQRSHRAVMVLWDTWTVVILCEQQHQRGMGMAKPHSVMGGGVCPPPQQFLCSGSPRSLGQRSTEMSPLGILQEPSVLRPSGTRCPVPSRQLWRGWGRHRRGHVPAAPWGTRGCSQRSEAAHCQLPGCL